MSPDIHIIKMIIFSSKWRMTAIKAAASLSNHKILSFHSNANIILCYKLKLMKKRVSPQYNLLSVPHIPMQSGRDSSRCRLQSIRRLIRCKDGKEQHYSNKHADDPLLASHPDLKEP